jgi:hypothetical protein
MREGAHPRGDGHRPPLQTEGRALCGNCRYNIALGWVEEETSRMAAMTRCLLLFVGVLLLLLPARAQEAGPDESTWRGHPALIDDLNGEIDKRVAAVGLNPGPALSWFSSADDTKFVYVRNPTSWVHDLDLTGVVVSHDYLCQGNHLTSGGALITPQDVVCAAHFAHPGGAVLNFVDANNVIHTGTVTKGAPVPGTDIYLCHLAAPVAGVTAYKVLPPDWSKYALDRRLRGWPLLMAYNFGHMAYLLDADGVVGELRYHRCMEPALAPYTTKISSGSGSPAFAVINGEPVLVGCLHTTGSTSWIADHEDAINTLLASLGSTSTLTTFDLSKPVSYARY